VHSVYPVTFHTNLLFRPRVLGCLWASSPAGVAFWWPGWWFRRLWDSVPWTPLPYGYDGSSDLAQKSRLMKKRPMYISDPCSCLSCITQCHKLYFQVSFYHSTHELSLNLPIPLRHSYKTSFFATALYMHCPPHVLRRVEMGSTPASPSGSPGLKHQPFQLLFLLFSQLLRIIVPQALPSTSFPFDCLLMTPSSTLYISSYW